ncbi:hypothetical protein GCM10012275_23570 [Longimycelium tulufanense]|uniref:Uncharacterized protein n=1 Tax=Longimycelium tulufanense TaxID=907463 RepID=A0A8J3C821_9PSEU|nr:hypothetical protein [Longimycelium tulufanense]GGM51925.1 hypothetical protein GCM10012275_23570 [Longimycelium tulufanense]
MPGDFRAKLDTIESCGRKVNDFEAKADAIKRKVTQAEVPDLAFGLIGQLAFVHIYHSMMSDFQEYLNKIGEGVKRAGEQLADTATEYRTCDDHTKLKIEAAMRMLDSSAQTPNTGAR